MVVIRLGAAESDHLVGRSPRHKQYTRSWAVRRGEYLVEHAPNTRLAEHPRVEVVGCRVMDRSGLFAHAVRELAHPMGVSIGRLGRHEPFISAISVDGAPRRMAARQPWAQRPWSPPADFG